MRSAPGKARIAERVKTPQRPGAVAGKSPSSTTLSLIFMSLASATADSASRGRWAGNAWLNGCFHILVYSLAPSPNRPEYRSILQGAQAYTTLCAAPRTCLNERSQIFYREMREAEIGVRLEGTRTEKD